MVSTEQNIATYQRYVAEIWNQHNIAAIDELATPNYVRHEPTLPKPVEGRDAFKAFSAGMFSAIPDATLGIDDIVANGDQVALRWHASGTMKGEMNGHPPTNRQAHITGINICRFENGLMAEEWSSWDVFGMMEQFGLLGGN